MAEWRELPTDNPVWSLGEAYEWRANAASDPLYNEELDTDVILYIMYVKEDDGREYTLSWDSYYQGEITVYAAGHVELEEAINDFLGKVPLKPH